MEKETQQVRNQLTLGHRDAQMAPPELKAGKGEERILSRPARVFLTGEWISRQSSVWAKTQRQEMTWMIWCKI